MAKGTSQLLVQEVNELTALLREDPAWKDMRNLLKQKGLVPGACFLAGFMESEERHECGVIVGPDGVVYEFERRTATKKQAARLIRWNTVKDVAALTAQSFPALMVGVELARTGK
jgi:hypothetical protein